MENKCTILQKTIVTRTGEICRKPEKGEVQWLCHRVMLQIQFRSDPNVQRKEMLQIHRNETKKSEIKKFSVTKKNGRGKDGVSHTSLTLNELSLMRTVICILYINDSNQIINHSTTTTNLSQ